MKTIFSLVSLLLGSAGGVWVFDVPLNATQVGAVIGGLASIGILVLAFSDYARKPRFRVRSVEKSVAVAPSAARPAVAEPACNWTYTTLSA